MRNYKIYRLVDPRYPPEDLRHIRYIGRTSDKLSKRLNEHCANWQREGGPKWDWFQDMARAGVRPDIILVESVDTAGEADDREQRWIAYYESKGYDLVNTCGSGRSRVWEKQRVIEDFQIEVMRLLLGQEPPYEKALRKLEEEGQRDGALYAYLQAANTPDLSLDEIPDLFRVRDEMVKGLDSRVMRAIGAGEIREPIASVLREAIEEGA